MSFASTRVLHWLSPTAVSLAVLPSASAQRTPTLRLGVHTQLMGAPDVIAIRQGYFKQEGLEEEPRL